MIRSFLSSFRYRCAVAINGKDPHTIARQLLPRRRPISYECLCICFMCSTSRDFFVVSRKGPTSSSIVVATEPHTSRLFVRRQRYSNYEPARFTRSPRQLSVLVRRAPKIGSFQQHVVDVLREDRFHRCDCRSPPTHQIQQRIQRNHTLGSRFLCRFLSLCFPFVGSMEQGAAGCVDSNGGPVGFRLFHLSLQLYRR